MMKFIKWGTLGFVGLVIVVAIAGGSSESKSSSSSSGTSSDTSTQADAKAGNSHAAAKPVSCGIKATDDCTPHVKMGHSVRVDALYWNATGVDTAATLGDQEYGLGAKADGTFVVVDLKVRSAKNESVTLSDNSVQIETADGNTYDSDSDGSIAAMGEGQDPLFLEDIGPDATVHSKVVFDLPASAMSKKLSLRFNELGLGSTHGYISLPAL
jgi:hypothetical protein